MIIYENDINERWIIKLINLSFHMLIITYSDVKKIQHWIFHYALHDKVALVGGVVNKFETDTAIPKSAAEKLTD